MVRRGCRRRRRGVARRAGGVAWIASSASRHALEGLGHRELPLRRVGRSRRRCLRRGRGHIRQSGRSSCSIGISTRGVYRRQSRGLARRAIGVVVVVRSVSRVTPLGGTPVGQPSRLAGRSRRCRPPRVRARAAYKVFACVQYRTRERVLSESAPLAFSCFSCPDSCPEINARPRAADSEVRFHCADVTPTLVQYHISQNVTKTSAASRLHAVELPISHTTSSSVVPRPV